ncbi:arylsulfatase [Coraliomargarita sinensis]|uniref:Arylsulfatase n=1 Tax=Coraliomargarita sinensis TaxID=2174842 RepID=A0A317ZHL9_9BACT|nr:sulfatase-like hydrolase/transferase [Coraliomargarita sinensis]PXA05065.1 arylsulfatase [Coraliomargarita sinensis]
MKLKEMLLCLLVALPLMACAAGQKPNVVIIYLDDAGYADFHPFGTPPYPTPHVEALAEQGLQLTQFYVPTAVCSSSRSSLLSGCYAGRHRVFGAHGPGGRGLNPKFTTIAEMLKAEGYATAHYGKWHCGDRPETRPMARGFDSSAGLMISNDMWRFNPVWATRVGKGPLPYWEDGKIAIEDVTPHDQKFLTKWATDSAVKFIRKQKERPFFLYVAHSMPHVPLYCSDAFLGKSGAGLYGDVMMEIDWSVGQINQALKDAGVARETIVIFSSDNGPWDEFGNHAGKTPFREHKGTSFDGGTRSPTIIKYPAGLESGLVIDRPLLTIDVLPTLAYLTGASLPDHEIDGKNVWPVLAGDEDTPHPHEYYVFEYGGRLEAVLSPDGRWKMHLPHPYRHVLEAGNDGLRGTTTTRRIGWALFDLAEDPYETTNVMERHPEIVERLKAYADDHLAKFYQDK